MTPRDHEADPGSARGSELPAGTLRNQHAFLVRWGTSREIGSRIEELRRIASWWASRDMPAEDDDAGSGFDTVLQRLETVRRAAEEVEKALEEGGYEFDGHLRVLRRQKQPSSEDDRPSQRARQLLSDTILGVFEQLEEEGQPNENTIELRLQIRARLAHCLHPDLLSDGAIKSVLDEDLRRKGDPHL